MSAPLLTAAEVAAVLKMETKWVERRAVAGEIASVKLGHYRRFTQAAVDLYIAKHSSADPMQRTTRSPRRRAA